MRFGASAGFAALAALCLSGPVNAASLINTSDTPAPFQISGTTHTLSLRCDAGSGKTLISRIAVLDVNTRGGPENFDVGITTAHGLIDEKGTRLDGCRVIDFSGHKYRIKSVRIAKDYVPGTPTDWAIITFSKAKKTPVVRYALASPLSAQTYDELAENRLNVKFSSARGLPGSGQNCHILPRRYSGFHTSQYVGLLPHSCRAVSGQSGAPVSIWRGDRNVIVGFHVGHALMLASPVSGRPSRHGYMRIFDDQLRRDVNNIVTGLHTKGRRHEP